jgi:hypothetical protein
MDRTAGVKKRIDIRGLITYYVFFILIYVCLLSFTGAFLMTWGAKRSLFERCLCIVFITTVLLGIRPLDDFGERHYLGDCLICRFYFVSTAVIR